MGLAYTGGNRMSHKRKLDRFELKVWIGTAVLLTVVYVLLETYL